MTTPRPVRYRCEIPSKLSLDGGGEAKARLLELSESGAFIEDVGALHEMQLDEGAMLSLPIPGGAPFQAHVRVERFGYGRVEVKGKHTAEHLSVAVRGLGVMFDEVDDDELERLRDFLELLDTR